MPTRVQALRLGLGSAAQPDIETISPTFVRMRKLNTDIPALLPQTENDAEEIGKGNEFITGVFKTNIEPAPQRIEKFGSAEFTLWAWAYALGDVGLSGGLYTIDPVDPGETLELPYFSIVSQIDEGGDAALDEAMLGNTISMVETVCMYGPGRSSIRTNAEFVGSGISAVPSAVTLPAPLTEYYMRSSSMVATINGTDYVTSGSNAKSLLRVSMTWNNNPILPMRYFPGSGQDSDGFSVGGRTFIGRRVPTLSFTAFLLKDSPEYAKLVALDDDTAVITCTYDSTHYVTWTYHNVQFERVERVQEEGIVAVQVTVAPKFSESDNSVLTVTGKCGIADIAQ